MQRSVEFTYTLSPFVDLSLYPYTHFWSICITPLQTTNFFYYPSTYHLLPLYLFLASLYYPLYQLLNPLYYLHRLLLCSLKAFLTLFLTPCLSSALFGDTLTRTPVRVTEAIIGRCNTFSISLMKDGGDNFRLLQKQVFIEIFSLSG